MVESAEAANDLVVSAQRDASASAAQQIAERADRLHKLAMAIVVLASESDNAP